MTRRKAHPEDSQLEHVLVQMLEAEAMETRETRDHLRRVSEGLAVPRCEHCLEEAQEEVRIAGLLHDQPTLFDWVSTRDTGYTL